MIRNTQQARGASMLEFAIAIPVVMMLILAIVEFSRYYFYSYALTESAKDASMLASTIEGLTDDTIPSGYTESKSDEAIEKIVARAKKTATLFLGKNSNINVNVVLPEVTTTLQDALISQPIEITTQTTFQPLVKAIPLKTTMEREHLFFVEIPKMATYAKGNDCLGEPIGGEEPAPAEKCACDANDPYKRIDPTTGQCTQCVGDTYIIPHTSCTQDGCTTTHECRCGNWGQTPDENGNCKCPPNTSLNAWGSCACDPITCSNGMEQAAPWDIERCDECACPHSETLVDGECQCVDLSCSPEEIAGEDGDTPSGNGAGGAGGAGNIDPKISAYILNNYGKHPTECRCIDCRVEDGFGSIGGDGSCECDVAGLTADCIAKGDRYYVVEEECYCTQCWGELKHVVDNECVCNDTFALNYCNSRGYIFDAERCTCTEKCSASIIDNKCECENPGCNSNQYWNESSCRCSGCDPNKTQSSNGESCICSNNVTKDSCHGIDERYNATECVCEPCGDGKSINTSTNTCDCDAGPCSDTKKIRDNDCICICDPELYEEKNVTVIGTGEVRTECVEKFTCSNTCFFDPQTGEYLSPE